MRWTGAAMLADLAMFGASGMVKRWVRVYTVGRVPEFGQSCTMVQGREVERSWMVQS
jgi:predicted metal-dependent RNase